MQIRILVAEYHDRMDEEYRAFVARRDDVVDSLADFRARRVGLSPGASARPPRKWSFGRKRSRFPPHRLHDLRSVCKTGCRSPTVAEPLGPRSATGGDDRQPEPGVGV
jgi:hypothetical protein